MPLCLAIPDAVPALVIFMIGTPPWSRVEGKSQVNLLQMPPLRGGIGMGVDERNHLFAPGLPPGRYGGLSAESDVVSQRSLTANVVTCFSTDEI